MNTMSYYRPSKRPKVSQVKEWCSGYWDTMESWDGHTKEVLVEQGYPFPDFFRVTYKIDGVKKSKLFYGESAWSDAERFVYDLGFTNVLGRI